MRPVLALLAFVVALLSGLAVALGLLTAVGFGLVQRPPDASCECPVADDDVQAVVVARVSGMTHERLNLDIGRVERGDVDGDVSVRSDGVTLAPWGWYRLFVFRTEDDGWYVSGDEPPERIASTTPAGLGALSALAPSVRFGLAALPAFAVSLWCVRDLRRT